MYKLFLWVVGHFCPPESGSGSSALQKAPHLWTVFVLHGLDALDDEEEDEADDGAQPQGVEQGGGERVSCLTQQKKPHQNQCCGSGIRDRCSLFFGP